MSLLPEPAASASKQEHADWLELLALGSVDQNSSIEDLVAAIKRAGSVDAIPRASRFDRGSEVVQGIVDAAFSEVERRSLHCAGTYPFVVSSQYLQLKDEPVEESPYLFMLLLKAFGVGAGPRSVKGATHFEEIAAEAGRRYLGGDSAGARSYPFGFPRRTAPTGFTAAVDALCMELGEGGGSRTRPRTRFQKDAKLDLVVWSPFPDGRPGKVVAFGQCAAGDDYDTKVTELSPSRFVRTWMADHIAPFPMLFFFVAACIDEDEWIDFVNADAILFDRCRISACLPSASLSDDLRNRTARWCRHVLNERLKA